MAAAEIDVEVVHLPAPHQLMSCRLRVPAGTTAGEAVLACGLFAGWSADRLDRLQLGRWGRACEASTVLRDRDRVELYRPLRVDPKEARRQRHQREAVRRKAATARR